MPSKFDIVYNNKLRQLTYFKNSSFIICLYFGTTNSTWLNAKSSVASTGSKLYTGGKHIFKHKKKKYISYKMQGSFCIFFVPSKIEKWNSVFSFLDKNKNFYSLGGKLKDVPFFAVGKSMKKESGSQLLHNTQKPYNHFLFLLYLNLVR